MMGCIVGVEADCLAVYLSSTEPGALESSEVPLIRSLCFLGVIPGALCPLAPIQTLCSAELLQSCQPPAGTLGALSSLSWGPFLFWVSSGSFLDCIS